MEFFKGETRRIISLQFQLRYSLIFWSAFRIQNMVMFVIMESNIFCIAVIVRHQNVLFIEWTSWGTTILRCSPHKNFQQLPHNIIGPFSSWYLILILKAFLTAKNARILTIVVFNIKHLLTWKQAKVKLDWLRQKWHIMFKHQITNVSRGKARLAQVQRRCGAKLTYSPSLNI